SASLHSFQVQWSTPQYATTGKILWGTSQNDLNQEVNSGRTQNNHSVTVDNIEDNQTYFFQIIASDEYGLERRSEIQSIRTKPDWDLLGLTTQANRFSVEIKWSTPDYPTSSELRWGFERSNLDRTKTNPNPSTEHTFFVDELNPSTIIYLQAFSRDEFGRERTSEIIQIQTLADWQLGGFEAQPDIHSLTINWNSGDEITVGTLRWGESETNLENSTISENGSANQHIVHLNGLNANTVYYLQAEAQDANGRTKRTNVIAVRTLLDPDDPAFVIQGLDAQATEREISLSWNTGDAETNATVLVGLSPDDLSFHVGQVIDFKKNHTYLVEGLNPNTTYYLQVIAKNRAGTSRSSQVIEVKTLSDWTIEHIQTNASKNSIQVNWNTGSEQAKGLVRWGLDENNLNNTIAVNDFATEHGVMIAGLQPDTLYYLQVEAIDRINRTETSIVYTVQTLPDVVAPPFEIKGFDGTTTVNAASLIWQTPGVPTVATLYVGLSADDLTYRVIEVSDYKESHLVGVAGLSANTDYFFKLVARNQSGFTVESEVIRKRTKSE
ncbi:MAG: fibronectin type III domain-containing protein, partial [Oligoflexia bacterium]|nr:fibronectin type III domain-containing protein [Oligoflexia bacterium]